MAATSITIAAIVAIFSGLLYLGEKENLPKYELLKLENVELLKGGYDLIDLESPRLSGISLRTMAYLIRTPVIGRIIVNMLAKDNQVIELRKLASAIPDMPLYYPYIEPAPSMNEAAEPWSLNGFSKQSDKFTASAFKHWTIGDYTSKYLSGELTPLQVARAVLAAVEENEKSEYPLRIFVEKHDDEILAQAKASSERYAQGNPLGILDGVPVAIKDEMAIKGYRMFVGTSFLGNEEIATDDDPPVARLRAAGAIILGKTNMHEIGAGVTGYNMHYGTVRNPYNPKCYTGGSSSGSAAAVASGLVPLAVGLDGGGSIRIPAALCGVVGIKPTFQRVPPLSPDCPSVSHIGPIAGSVRDAAIGYAVMSGGDDSFPRGHTQPKVNLRSFEDTNTLKGVKIGYFSAYNNHSSPAISASIEKALQVLKDHGAELVEVELHHLKAIHLAHSLTISGEMAQNLDKYYSRFGEISPEVVSVLTYARGYSAMDFLAAQRVRAFALRQFQEKVFSKVDIFVAPSTGITAPEIPADALAVGELNGKQLGDIFRFSVYGNLIGIPGVAVPIGYDERGLPLSIQFQASHWEEDLMLRLAHTTEKLYAATQKKPEIYFSILEDAEKQPRD